LKSFDATPGGASSGEIDHVFPDIENAADPTETTETTHKLVVGETGGTEAGMDSAAVKTSLLVASNVGNTSTIPDQAEAQEPISDSVDEDEDEIEDETPVRRHFRGPTRVQLRTWAPYWAVILLGGILRFWDLGAKPLHHDESLHAYFSLQLLHNLQNWGWCVGLNNPPAGYSCYTYDPLLHGPFQFHAIALVYQISQWLGAPDNGVNTTTVRIMAALLGTVLVALPYFLRDYLGKVGAWLACFLLAVSPSMVYFSRFAREDIYMACFTLLMVVAVGRYIRDRKMRWILLAIAGFALSYATSEATFLTIAVFGSFMIGLIIWEIGSKIPWRARFAKADAEEGAGRFLPRSFAPALLLVYVLIAGIVAKVALGILGQLSVYINSNTNQANADLANLESITIRVIPWLGIILGLYVFSILAREIYGKVPVPGQRRGLARLVDRRQPVLDTLLTMPWTHWFFPLILGWAIFVFLFSVVFTNLAQGIGDGIWKGLYYWLEQQNVARGGQPWYYYLMLIPLYEQIGVVFGVVGIIRCLRRPNAFRLFLVYWFLGDFFIYSWAGEKMPWLMIFMTMPMMILAAIGVEPSVMACYQFLKERFFSRSAVPATAGVQTEAGLVPGFRPRLSGGRVGLGIFGVVMALLLLLPTLHNMYEVTYVEPADGPHEMMIYVQTTTDVNTVMANIAAVDQKDFGGKHKVEIGVTGDATWPFAWYLRDYTNVCYNFPDACPTWKTTAPIILAGGDDPYGDISTYAPANGNYLYHEYDMRSWWDEGYKLPPCTNGQKPSASCADPSLGTGVGPGLYLSYGDNPPPGATFNLGLAAQRIWNWWWYRVPFGSTTGAYNMELFIQKGMGVNP